MPSDCAIWSRVGARSRTARVRRREAGAEAPRALGLSRCVRPRRQEFGAAERTALVGERHDVLAHRTLHIRVPGVGRVVGGATPRKAPVDVGVENECGTEYPVRPSGDACEAGAQARKWTTCRFLRCVPGARMRSTLLPSSPPLARTASPHMRSTSSSDPPAPCCQPRIALASRIGFGDVGLEGGLEDWFGGCLGQDKSPGGKPGAPCYAPGPCRRARAEGAMR